MTEVKFKMWRKKDGSEVRIKDLEDAHLVNAISVCRKIGESRANFAVRAASIDDPGPFDPMFFEPNVLADLEFEARVRGIVI